MPSSQGPVTGNPKKVYTRVVMDMNTLETIEEEFYEYDGPWALCEGATEEQIAAAKETLKGAGVHLLDEWREGMPEEISAAPWMEKFNGKGVADLAKSYHELERAMGGEAVKLPKADATDEEWRALFARLGAPDAPEGYEIGPPADAPQGMRYNKDFEAAFRKKAHELGVPKKHVKGLYDLVMQQVAGNVTAAQQAAVKAREENEAALKQEWGGEYEPRTKRILSAATVVGGADFAKLLSDTGLINTPVVAKAMFEVSKFLKEDDIGGGGGGGTGLTPKEALSAASKMRNDPKHPLNIKDHPEHKEALKEYQRLYAMAYPEEK